MDRTESFNNISDRMLYIDREEAEFPREHPLECSNVSWASLVEEELGELGVKETSLSEFVPVPVTNPVCLTSLTTDSNLKLLTPQTKQQLYQQLYQQPQPSPKITLDQLDAVDLKDVSSLEVLKTQGLATGSLRRMVNQYLDLILNKQPSSFELELFLQRLDWLIASSDHLSQQIGLPVNRKKKTPITVECKVIPRSSYQFCSYRHECEFNYDHEKHKGCFAQHFVHN